MPKASCHQQSNNSDAVDGHEMQDTLDMSESRNEDDREEAELKRMQRRSVGLRKQRDMFCLEELGNRENLKNIAAHIYVLYKYVFHL